MEALLSSLLATNFPIKFCLEEKNNNLNAFKNLTQTAVI